MRGNEEGFDANNVEVYGFAWDTGSLNYGQTTWSGLARSLGFELLNTNPWGTEYNYDDPRLAELFQWYRKMIDAGYMPPLEQVAGLGQATLFQAGRSALALDGSWMIGTYTTMEDLDVGFAPQPAGPEGSWSMFNGLADSIWEGTAHPEESWEWVKFLASEDCQSIVGESAVVFPAIPSAAELAVQTHESNGIDVSAFTSYLEDDHTLLFPITDKAAVITMAVSSSIESIMLGDSEPAPALEQVNQQVNSLLD